MQSPSGLPQSILLACKSGTKRKEVINKSASERDECEGRKAAIGSYRLAFIPHSLH